MQMKRMVLTLAVVLAVVLAVLPGTSLTAIRERLPDSKNSLERAKELWEMAIIAKGGRDRLYAINSLVISEDINKNNRLSSSLYVFPDKFWDWSDYRPYRLGLQVSMENHELGIGYFVVGHEPNNPSKIKLSPEHRSKFDDAQLIYLLEAKWFKPELLGVSKSRIGLKRADVVELKARGFKIGVFLDEKTHLPIQVVYYSTYKAGKILNRFELSDYREIVGILIPHSINVGGSGWGKVKVEVNVKYDHRVFERLPDISAGPEQWRAADSTPLPKKTT